MSDRKSTAQEFRRVFSDAEKLLLIINHVLNTEVREFMASVKVRHDRLAFPHDHRAHPWDICCAEDLRLALDRLDDIVRKEDAREEVS